MARRKPNYTVGKYQYHRIRETFGTKPDGSPNRKEFIGKTYEEAKNKRDAYAKLHSAGIDADLMKQPLGAALKTWLFQVKKHDSKIRPVSFERYESIYRNHVANKSIAAKKVGAVTKWDAKAHLDAMAATGKSYSQIRSTVKLLKMFFTFAVEEGFTALNPFKKIAIPGERPVKTTIERFTPEEIEKIKEEMVRCNYRNEFLVLLGLGTGLRRGELLALRYADIQDWNIHVENSLSAATVVDDTGARTWRISIGPTKTNSSVRIVPIPAGLKEAYHKHRRHQLEECMRLGLGEPEYLFTSEIGGILDPRNLGRSFNRLLDRAGVEHKKFHALRHTYGSNLVAAGVPVPTVMTLMGHSSIETTMIYVTILTDEKEQAVAVMNRFFTPSLPY